MPPLRNPAAAIRSRSTRSPISGARSRLAPDLTAGLRSKTSLGLQARFRIDFLDTKRIEKQVPREVRASLARPAGFIRTTAKRSIRKRRGASRPGAPPHSHEGSLRRHLFFGFDRVSASFVTGPLSIRRSPVPSVLEHGGRVRVTRRRRGDQRSRKRIRSKRVVAIAKRPYMLPALNVALQRQVIPRSIRSSVRGGA